MRKIAFIAMAFAVSAVALSGCSAAEGSGRGESPGDELATTSAAAISVCEDFLSGDLDAEIAEGILEDYEDEVDALCDELQEEGVYSSADLYVGQLRATVSSWDKLQIADMNPEAMLESDMELLQDEIGELRS